MHYIYCRHEYCNNDETLWLFSSRSAHRPFCFHMNKCTSSRSTIIMNSFPNNIWKSIILCCGKFVHPGSTVVCPCCVTHEMVARWPSSSQSMRCHDKWSLKVGKGWKLLCGKSRLYEGWSYASQPKFCSMLRVCRAVYGRAPSRSRITTWIRRPWLLHLMASRQLLSLARYLSPLNVHAPGSPAAASQLSNPRRRRPALCQPL